VTQTATFVNAGSGNFLLGGADAAARNFGANLSCDPYLSFTKDVTGADRSEVWDIGADGVP